MSIDSFPYYGSDEHYLNYLARFVKPDGVIGIAGAGLLREFEEEVPAALKAWWEPNMSCFHSAAWWRRHWERTGILNVDLADSMPDTGRGPRVSITIAYLPPGVVTTEDGGPVTEFETRIVAARISASVPVRRTGVMNGDAIERLPDLTDLLGSSDKCKNQQCEIGNPGTIDHQCPRQLEDAQAATHGDGRIAEMPEISRFFGIVIRMYLTITNRLIFTQYMASTKPSSK